MNNTEFYDPENFLPFISLESKVSPWVLGVDSSGEWHKCRCFRVEPLLWKNSAGLIVDIVEWGYFFAR